MERGVALNSSVVSGQQSPDAGYAGRISGRFKTGWQVSAFAADNIMVRLRLLAVRKYGNFVFVSDNILGLYRREDARRLARVYLAIVF